MIEARDIGKSYPEGGAALSGVSVAFGDNGLVAICGPAACGKTTLLNILGGIERPDSGELFVDGVSTQTFREGKWNEYRNARVGFAFQDPVLVGHRTVLENVEQALTIAGVGHSERRERAAETLATLGMESCASRKPSSLSGAQQRLVAIARALVKDPDILLADEPMCGLDKSSAETVMRALERVAQKRLVILSTSDEELAARHASRVICLAGGEITSDVPASAAPTGAGAVSAAASAAPVGMPSDAANTVPVSMQTDATASAVPAGMPSDVPASAAPADAQANEDSAQASEEATDSNTSARSRRSMPFSAAVSYSIRNISAKKGRAILTAIASAISMVGIAAIVALGGGANNYIAYMEEASIATDPIVVEKSGLDLTGLLSSDNVKNKSSQGASADSGSSASGSNNSGDSSSSSSSSGGVRINTLEESIQNVSSVLSEVVSHIRDNDLVGFKQFVDSNSSGILNYVDTVQYDYGVSPLVYNGDTSHGVERLNPSTLTSLFTRRANSTTSTLNALGRFNEMIDNQSILDEQMDVVCGTWPKSFDECVIVLDENGGISDLTLYYIGLYDHDEVDKAIKAALNGESIDLPATPSNVTYEQLMGASFVVLPRVSLYQKNAARGTWADKSLDDAYVAQKIAQDGIKLKVTGIVQPKKGTYSPLMSEGVGYMHSLTDYLIEVSAQSEITKQQIANPTVDVFTNRSFEDLKVHPAGNLDLDNVITINKQALGRLIGMFKSDDENKSEEENTEVLGVDLSEIDWSLLEIDERDILDAVNTQRLFDAIALASMLDPAESGLQLTEEQQAQVSALTGEMVAGFTAYAIAEGATAEELQTPNVVQQYWKEYLKTEEGKLRMAELDLLVGQSYGDLVREQLEDYLTTVYAEVIIDEVVFDIIEQSLDEIANEIEKELERQLPGIAEKLGDELEKAIVNALNQILVEVQQGASAVGNEVSNLIQINMNEEDLVAFLNNLLDSSEIGYDNNMAKLGYADKSKPLSMSIYPKDLASKQKVVEIITSYNADMEKAGMQDRTIIYKNSSGDMSQALSGIVGVVGLVLIALIGVSLVVGSLMLALVTCTGIAERRREMGLLRALGASRGNLVTMFNVETLLEGLLAGVIAVGLVLAISAGVNGAVAQSGGVKIMDLPPEAAIGLIALSGVLPLLAGLIPSLVMSRKRPAQALRN